MPTTVEIPYNQLFEVKYALYLETVIYVGI